MKRSIAMSMILAILFSFMLPVQAAMVSTGELLGQQPMVNERVKLTAFLERDDVQKQFLTMGVSSEQVKERVASMTDQEVAEINHKMNSLPAGGDVLGIAALIFIVFVITDVLGATDIFPFIKPIK